MTPKTRSSSRGGMRPVLAKIALTLAATAVAGPLALTPASAQTQKHGGTAVVVIGTDPTGSSPDVTSGTTDLITGCMIHEGLLRSAKGFVLKPGLAESWSVSPDGLVYTFHLAEAKFHDGTTLTSEDVKFTLENISAKYGPYYAASAKFVKVIDTPDPRTVIITLSQPFAPLLRTLLCDRNTAIMPAHVYRGTDVLKNPATTISPVGAGPFKMKEWVKGRQMKLEAHKDYYRKGEPYLDGIVVTVMPEAGTRMLALRAGEIDYIDQYYFPASSVSMVANDPRFQLNNTRDPSDDVIVLNTKQPYLAKPEARQALYQAIDRNYLLKNVFLAQGDVGRSAIDTRLAWAYNPAVDFEKLYPYDPAAAAKKLDAAGLPVKADGTRFTMRIAYDNARPEYGSLGEAIKSYWQAIGVKTVLEAVERPVVLQRVYSDFDFDATIQTYGTAGDPVIGIESGYTTESIQKGVNFMNASSYSNPEVDRLFAEGQKGVTPEDRARPYYKLQEILATEMPIYVLHQASVQGVATSKLKDLWLASGLLWWGSVWMDQ